MHHAARGNRPRIAAAFPPGRGERGSALVIALLVVVILALLGLSFMLAGETESKIARNQRDAAQAGFVAEGGVRMVKKWFDAPSGANAHFVPTISQMDRSLRYVDDDGDGTYVPYASATDTTYRVQYRQTTNDPFEKPYRGNPALALLGTEDHPDVRISDSGSSGEQAFLTTLNAELYPGFPDAAHNQVARIRQIDVYSPPIIVIGGQRTRYGIATVKVTADIYQYVGSPEQTRIATRVVKAVLNEAPYLGGPGGPLQSCQKIVTNGEFTPHWGMTTSVDTLNLHNLLDQKVNSSVPYKPGATYSYILPDMNGDGSRQSASTPGNAATATPDDQNYDGTLDFYNWVAGPNAEDPWVRFMSERNVTSGSPGNPIPPGCTGADCQPDPWMTPGAPPTFAPGDVDHSNIFENVSRGLCPEYDYAFWKGVALGGGENVHYYQSVGGGNFRLFGQGSNVTFRQAVDGKNGLFFFDTSTNSAPVDANSDGTYDNLTVDVDLSGQGLMTGGFVYLNANVRTTGSGNTTTQRELIAPGEPFNDANLNNKYDPDEWFIDITYPNTLGGTYVKTDAHRVADGFTRQDPATDAGTAGKWMADINMYGVFYTSGNFDAQGNWIFYGATVTKSGMTAGSGTPGFYWDERLVKDMWPPASLNLPRTVITAWQTDL